MRPSHSAVSRCLGVWLCAAGCTSAPAATARPPSSAAESKPASSGSTRGRWLLHGALAGPASADGVAVSYLATWLGSERAGRTVQLPSAYSVSFSADGKWLALCGPNPSSTPSDPARRASVIRFEAERVSDPIDLGACQKLEWAPTGTRLLLQGDSDWRLVELGGSEPLVRELGARLEAPVSWSKSGRYFVAQERDGSHALALVSLLQPTLPPHSLEPFGLPRGACNWSSSDALACAVERNGKHELLLAQLGAANADPELHVTEAPLPLTWLGWGTDRVVAYELARGGGVYALGGDLKTTRLFEPASDSGLDYFRLSPIGRWLLDCAGDGARLWDLGSVPRSVPLPGLPPALVNPRWSMDGKHALLGVRHAQHASQQTDVWLISEAATAPKLVRIASVAPARQSFAVFSPGSRWVLVSVAGDVPMPAAPTGSPAASEAGTPRSFAVDIAAGSEQPLPLGVGEWAADDSAFVVNQNAHLLAFRVRGSEFVGPEDLGSSGPGAPRLLWQP